MRIGIDATCWNNRRGYGRHLRSLLTAAAAIEPRHEYLLFTDEPPAGGYHVPENGTVVRVGSSAPTVKAARAYGSRSLRGMAAMSRALSRQDLDLVFFPTVYSLVPVFSRAPKLLMIHDVIAETFPRHVLPDRLSRWRWRLKSSIGRAQAARLLTVSEYSRSALAEKFGLAKEKIRVVGEAPDPVFQPLGETALPDSALRCGVRPEMRLILYVGGFGPHKNVRRLLRAFDKLAAREPGAGAQLVLVGDFENDPFYSDFEELRRLAGHAAAASRILFTGFLSDEDLVRLLNCSEMLVLPSLMEGYGLPGVEAAACGTPVVATKNSPLPELLGSGMLAIDPRDEDELESAMGRLLADRPLRDSMAHAARDAASRLTWERAAQQLLEVLGEMA